MSAPIIIFICTVVLAALVLVWIAYCMFIRERHKSEAHQYDITDLRHRNYQIAQEEEVKQDQKKMEVGLLILPSRRKQKDEYYDKRPDYPEGAIPNLQPSSDRLIEILNDDVADDADVHYEDGIIENLSHSNSQYHSDV